MTRGPSPAAAARPPGPTTLADLRRCRGGEIAAIAARHGATNVGVFGSVARGDADSNSDVDLLVDFGPGTSLFTEGGLVSELEDLLGYAVGRLRSAGRSASARGSSPRPCRTEILMDQGQTPRRPAVPWRDRNPNSRRRAR